MNPKRFFIFLISTIIALMAGAIVSGYILDPFQIYHAPFYSKDRYLENDRYQNAGLINRVLEDGECCDTVILGASHSQNFTPDHVTEAFKAKGTLDLTMMGARSTEQEVLFGRVKENNSLERVIWGIHTTYSEKELYEVNEKSFIARAPDKYFPLFLYDRNVFNDIKYLASIDSFLNAYKLYSDGKTYNTLKSWYSENLPSFNQGAALARQHSDLEHKEALKPVEGVVFPSIDDVLTPIVKENKHINFIFFIPPYSKHYYANLSQADFTVLMNMRQHLAQALSSYGNVELFVFDNILESTHSLDNYKDLAHYNEDTSKRIVEFMAKNKGNLNVSNVQEDIKLLVENVNLYIDVVEKRKF